MTYQYPYRLLLISLLCLLSNGTGTETEVIQAAQIDIDGTVTVEKAADTQQKVEEQPKPKPKHPNALEVIFENQSGSPVELYWDDSKSGVLQASIDHTHQTTINTFLGHRFYYTPVGKNGSKDTSLYTVTMAAHTGLITLYDAKTMEDRGVEFEKEQSKWMKEYFDRTGRRWQNFYPRDQVTHHYHDAQQGIDSLLSSHIHTTQFYIFG